MAVGLRNLRDLAFLDNASRQDAESSGNRILCYYVQPNYEDLYELFNLVFHGNRCHSYFNGHYVSRPFGFLHLFRGRNISSSEYQIFIQSYLSTCLIFVEKFSWVNLFGTPCSSIGPEATEENYDCKCNHTA